MKPNLLRFPSICSFTPTFYRNSFISFGSNINHYNYVCKRCVGVIKNRKKWDELMKSMRLKKERRLKKLEEEQGEKSTQIVDQYALTIQEAIKRAICFSRLTHDETIEICCRLNLDPRKADQLIRGNISLPHGSGKKRRIAVYIPNEYHEEAKKNGAEVIIDKTMIESIKSGTIPPFDVCIATPSTIKDLIVLGKQLGPLRLMPNAKMGTLTTDPIKAIQEAKKGQVPVRLIEHGLIQAAIGKASFGFEKIQENFTQFIIQLRDDLKPPGAIKPYFIKVVLSSSHGRGYEVIIDDREPWKQPK